MRREVIASSEVHPQSRLFARLEDDGTCGHVLIYKVGKRKEEYAALWIYNRTAEPMESETPSDFPPADRESVGAGAICERPEVSAWTFLWSATGEAVALAQDGRLVGFIDLAENSPTQADCCRNLVSGVNWGEPWEDDLYQAVVWSIRPAKAFDGKAARLAKKWRAEGACWLDLPPSPPSPVEFGRAKNMRKAGLKEHLKHPIWVSAHDDSHDEESIKPIISTDDVIPHVDDFAPIITFRVEETKVYGVGQYDHACGCLYGLAVWEGNRWADVRKARGLTYPLTLASVARIRGEAGVKFVCKDRADDNAYRTGAREGLPPTPAAAPVSPEVHAARQSLRSKAWEPRIESVDWLTQIGSESALTALAESLRGDRDVRVRLRAAFALGAIRTDATVPPMIDALHCDRDPLVRMRAAFALGQVASGSAMPALADCLRRDKDPRVRRRAAEALKEVGREQAIPALIQALKEPDAAVRRVVAHALGTLFQEDAGEENRDAAVGPLVQMLRRDPDTQVRRTVAWALRAVGGPKAVSALVEALRADKEPTVRQRAAIDLRWMNDKTAAPALKQASKDTDPLVRQEAARALESLVKR